jgi:FixJ family two-component response regulator
VIPQKSDRCKLAEAWRSRPFWELALQPYHGPGEVNQIQDYEIVRNSKVVFVVDDDPGTLRGVKRLLRQHGYDSVLFESAEAFQSHSEVDQALCVVLDINLNEESGIEVRHRLKAAGISVPVIYITGNDSHAVRMAALESGCIAYLTKPFSAKSLIEPLKQASAGLA